MQLVTELFKMDGRFGLNRMTEQEKMSHLFSFVVSAFEEKTIHKRHPKSKYFLSLPLRVHGASRILCCCVVTCSGGICQPSHTICQVPLRCPSQQDVRVSGWNGLEQTVGIIVADHKVGVTMAGGETGSPCGNIP